MALSAIVRIVTAEFCQLVTNGSLGQTAMWSPCWKRKHGDLGRTHIEALNKLHGYSGSRNNADMDRRRNLLSQDTFY